MQNFTLYKNYSQISENYQLKLPIDLDVLIPEDDSVRLLSLMMEELDYKKLYEAYSQNGRNPAVPPKILFKILIYAYMNDIWSSRKIELACKRDVNFMWLLEGFKAPDHNTIARFRTGRLEPILDDLFNQFIVKLYKNNELELKNLFIDGTKIEANANKYTFVWKKTVSKNEIKLGEAIKLFIKSINDKFNKNFSIVENTLKCKLLNEILEFLNSIKLSSNIEFVYGKGKRKTELQKLIEEANKYLERQSKYDLYNSIFNGRNSFSKTDIDATFMHMKDDHMKNAQLKPGYNIQIGVEGEYIVGVDISSERSDQLTFIPFLDKLGESLPAKYENIIADAGYESEENYVYLEENNQKSFIKPQNYENTKSKKFKNNIGKRENMIYNKIADTYTCANNKELKFIATTTRKSKSGYISKAKIYECENCNDCPIKSKCTKAKGNKRIQVSPVFITKRKQSQDNITSEFGILARMNRSIQVEGAFGVIKENHNFRRFLTRGKKNVKVEFLLLALAYNLNKLHHKIQQNRLGVSFYTKAIA